MAAEKLATAKSIGEALERRSELGGKGLTEEEFLEELRDPLTGIDHYLSRLHRNSEGALLPESAKDPELQALSSLLTELAHLKRALKKLAGSEWFDCGRHPAPESSDLPTPQSMAISVLKLSLEERSFGGVLPDGTTSELNLTDPKIRAAELQRFISQLKAFEGLDLADPPIAQAAEAVTEVLEKQIVRSLDPSFYIGSLISERYGFTEGEVAVPEGTRDEAALFLAHQVSLARASLGVIATPKLSCWHERVYAGGIVSPGNAIYTPAEIAQSCLEELQDWQLKGVKLDR